MLFCHERAVRASVAIYGPIDGNIFHPKFPNDISVKRRIVSYDWIATVRISSIIF